MGLYIVLTKQKQLFTTDQPVIMAARACMGAIALTLTFTSVRYLPISYATTLSFVSTLLVPIFAVMFLKERLGVHRIVAVLIGFGGVLLVAQPSGTAAAAGVICALLAGAIRAGVQTTLRALKTQNPFTVTFYFFLGGFILPWPFVFYMGHVPSMHSGLWLLGIGVIGIVAQLSLTMAFKKASASTVSPFSYTGLLWAMVFDFMIWGIAPDHVVLSGAALIVGASLYIVYRERQLNLQRARELASN